MKTPRSSYEAHEQMRAGAASLSSERAAWAAMLADRDEKRAARVAARKPASTLQRIVRLFV